MDLVFYNNTVAAWGIALLTAFSTALALYAAGAFLVRKITRFSERTSTFVDDLVVAMLRATWRAVLLAVGVYVASLLLVLPPNVKLLVWRIAVVAMLVQVGVWADTGIRTWRRQRASIGLAGDAASTAVAVFVMRVVVWTIATLTILDNLGFNITTLVASLGIGGIAVALAVQNVLGDLFASLSISLDKPFKVGDFLVVDNEFGTVEFIGLKTTRLRALGGEQTVFSNADLLKSRIHNHGRMQSRRVAFVLRVAYDTDADRLEAIPAIVREIVTSHAPVRFERAHMSAFGEWSLDIEVVYHVGSPDYLVHMDIQQAVFLAIVRRLAAEGIRFAQPTRTLMLQGEGLPAGRPDARAAGATRH